MHKDSFINAAVSSCFKMLMCVLYNPVAAKICAMPRMRYFHAYSYALSKEHGEFEVSGNEHGCS